MNGNKVFSNLIWRFSERIGAKLISVIVNLILARILAPELYGTVAIVLVFTEILQVFVESGFGTALIQKKDADDLDFSSVFFFNLAVSVLLYALLFAAAPLIARLYRKPELMLFKRFFFATLGGTVIAAVVGISMAMKGFGVWAYVAQYLLNNLVGTMILWFTVKWRPKMQFSLERLKGLFSYGWKLLVSSVLNIVSDKLRPLLIGYRFSASDLSFYNEGILFPNLIVDNVNSSIDSVLLPALSQQQDSAENVKAMTRRAIQISSYIMWPLMIGLFVCARPLVSLLLGEEWLPCIPFLRIFSLYYALFPIHTANLNAIKAMGRSDIFLKLEILKRVLDFAFVLVTLFIGVRAMAIGLLGAAIAGIIAGIAKLPWWGFILIILGIIQVHYIRDILYRIKLQTLSATNLRQPISLHVIDIILRVGQQPRQQQAVGSHIGDDGSRVWHKARRAVGHIVVYCSRRVGPAHQSCRVGLPV